LAKRPIRRFFFTLIYRIKQAVWQGIDLLFPPVCAGCGQTGQRFCDKCKMDTPKPNPMLCVLCGERLKADQPHKCSRSTFIDKALVWGLHAGPLRRALHRFKYKRDLGLAEIFGDLMAAVYEQVGQEVDLVVPVPLGKKRHRERGYNQAALLAAVVSAKLGISQKTSAVKRIRETESQVGLSIDRRRQNVAGAFRATPGLVAGKRVLLVDDVLTTGATLNACAQALKEAGAHMVITLTLARAP
jgi:ComF family protein